MSKLTLDEAIKRFEKLANLNETMGRFRPLTDYPDELESKEDSLERASEERQLAEWLTELKDLRDENKVLIQKCDRLIKEKEELNKLREKAVLDICRREASLKEAKRLLKSATDVLKMFIPCDEDYNCSECIRQKQNCDYDDSFKWRYIDEALKLIGEDGNM